MNSKPSARKQGDETTPNDIPDSSTVLQIVAVFQGYVVGWDRKCLNTVSSEEVLKDHQRQHDCTEDRKYGTDAQGCFEMRGCTST